MKPYAVTLLISATIIFILRIFYEDSSANISHNLNLFSASEINPQEAKSFIYFYLMITILGNYLIFHKHIVFKLVYCLLIALNILRIISSLK
ncbi:hypothetical protein CRN76_04245 [Chryseobacterium indologenes]|nr:hypothetical protein CRN76_04245 [Chryseobacterium indologenes]AYY86580.1 hypothetical protein EGX91_19515 [Chryseobacterium indologenes]HAO28465.1 hypothetical protein [Chryseobacterium indologenes]